MSSQTEAKGFTLIELAIILIIVALIASIQVLGLQKAILPRYHLKGAGRNIVADLQYAKMRATSSNKEYRVSFNIASEEYRLERGDQSTGSTDWTAESVKKLADPNGPNYRPGVEISSVTSNPVLIKPTGTMTATTIRLKNAKGKFLRITSTLIGRIRYAYE